MKYPFTEYKPWQAVPRLDCYTYTCTEPATRSVHGSEIQPDTVTYPEELLSCERHMKRALDGLCDKYGASGSSPLKIGWKFYLTNRLGARLPRRGVSA